MWVCLVGGFTDSAAALLTACAAAVAPCPLALPCSPPLLLQAPCLRTWIWRGLASRSRQNTVVPNTCRAGGTVGHNSAGRQAVVHVRGTARPQGTHLDDLVQGADGSGSQGPSDDTEPKQHPLLPQGFPTPRPAAPNIVPYTPL